MLKAAIQGRLDLALPLAEPCPTSILTYSLVAARTCRHAGRVAAAFGTHGPSGMAEAQEDGTVEEDGMTCSAKASLSTWLGTSTLAEDV